MFFVKRTLQISPHLLNGIQTTLTTLTSFNNGELVRIVIAPFERRRPWYCVARHNPEILVPKHPLRDCEEVSCLQGIICFHILPSVALCWRVTVRSYSYFSSNVVWGIMRRQDKGPRTIYNIPMTALYCVHTIPFDIIGLLTIQLTINYKITITSL